mmetsp:Transcript_6717/g.19277  ORF Transcript_6717/g.19277 Transcript_6717/m.19277 type:complete len:373 (-) Transcript_6717:178-1296(-)
MPGVDEEQLRRAVLGVLRCLLLPDERKVPEHDAAVGAAACQHVLAARVPLDVEDLGGVRPQVVKRRRRVAQVPELHDLVRRARRHEMLIHGVEGEAIHVVVVRSGHVPRRGGLARVPDVERTVVADAAEEVRVAHVPGHVLDDIRVRRLDSLGLDGHRRVRRHVPKAHLAVVRAAQELALAARVPREAVALAVVADAAVLRRALGVGARHGGVLGDVEDEHVRRRRLRRDDHRVLRHVPRAVHLAVVRDLHIDLHLAVHGAEAADLPLLIVVAPRVDLRLRQRQVHVREHEVVHLAGRVRAEDEFVLGDVLALHGARAGHPLHGERRPLQRVRHDEVIQEGRVLLPDLVLLGDGHLLLLARRLRHRLRIVVR